MSTYPGPEQGPKSSHWRDFSPRRESGLLYSPSFVIDGELGSEKKHVRELFQGARGQIDFLELEGKIGLSTPQDRGLFRLRYVSWILDNEVSAVEQRGGSKFPSGVRSLAELSELAQGVRNYADGYVDANYHTAEESLRAREIGYIAREFLDEATKPSKGEIEPGLVYPLAFKALDEQGPAWKARLQAAQTAV